MSGKRPALAVLAALALVPATAQAEPRNLATCHVQTGADGHGFADCVGYVGNRLVTDGGTARITNRQGALQIKLGVRRMLSFAPPSVSDIPVVTRLRPLAAGELLTLSGPGRASGAPVSISGAGTWDGGRAVSLSIVITPRDASRPLLGRPVARH